MANHTASGRPWRRVRAKVLERDGYRCQIGYPGCTVLATQVDHVRPLSAGGAKYDPANLRASCRRCNAARPSGQAVTTSRAW